MNLQRIKGEMNILNLIFFSQTLKKGSKRDYLNKYFKKYKVIQGGNENGARKNFN